MAAKQLTAAAVEKMRPAAARREVPDGGARGLFLVIQPSGKKSFALRYRRPGTRRPAKLVLGDALVGAGSGAVSGEPDPAIGGALTLAAARRLAAKLQHDIAQRHDPAAEYLAGKRSAAARGDTFGQAAADFARHARRTTRRWQGTAALLGLREGGGDFVASPGGLAERWRDRPVAEVSEDDVFHVIDEAREKGVPGLPPRRPGEPSEARARAMHAALSVLFGWLRARRRLKTSPLAGLKRPAAPRPRERILTDAEVRLFWRATGELGGPFGAALRVMLITGARRNEVAAMRRSELSDDLASWTLPPARTKNKREHVVPLPPTTRELVKGRLSELSEYVFTTDGRTPISGWSKAKRRIDALMAEAAGAPVPDWRVHDLRRTMITGAARAGADLHVIERAVNHVSGSFGGIVATYQKHKFADEVRAALEAWSNLLAAIVEDRPANVVALRMAEAAT